MYPGSFDVESASRANKSNEYILGVYWKIY